MTTITEHAAPEDLMALYDGELSRYETEALRKHLAACPQCSAQLETFEALSRTMTGWAVPPAPNVIAESLPLTSKGHSTQRHIHRVSRRRLGWKVWVLGFSGAAAVLLAVSWPAPQSHSYMADVSTSTLSSVAAERYEPQRTAAPAPAARRDVRNASAEEFSTASKSRSTAALGGGGDQSEPSPKIPPTSINALQPMIARSATIYLSVKDFTIARREVESILIARDGYFAHFDVDSSAPFQTLGAKLRVPASKLDATLRQLRTLGHVDRETQTGEDVTAQHADLAARLTNARETEARLRGLLAERTGRVSDVLEVEEQISSTREEIETMEADQQTLEHRVSYSSIDLTLTEEAHTPPVSTSTHLHEAFTNGIHAVGDSVLSLIFFLGEDGPTLLFWLAILGVPAWLFVRHYRRMRKAQ